MICALRLALLLLIPSSGDPKRIPIWAEIGVRSCGDAYCGEMDDIRRGPRSPEGSKGELAV
jgi:hypothetical protein